MKKMSFSKVKENLSLTKVKEFLWENKGTIFQLAIMTGVMAAASDVSFASDATPTGYDKLTTPLKGLQDTLTGPVAKGVGIIGIVTCGLATASNMEQQVVKRSLQILGGAGAGMGAATVISAAGSGLVFF